MVYQRHALALALALSIAEGCLLFVDVTPPACEGCDAGMPVDAGRTIGRDDAGVREVDAGDGDAGLVDAGAPDAGPRDDDDAGPDDRDPGDGGTPHEDAGPLDDGGVVDVDGDAGFVDGGAQDGGAQDGGAQDGGPNDRPDGGDLVDAGVDQDGDGVDDALDNCPRVANADQEDADGDDVGAACDCDDSEEDETRVVVYASTLTSDTGSFAVMHPVGLDGDVSLGTWSFGPDGLVQSAHTDDRMDLLVETTRPLVRPRIAVRAMSTTLPAGFDDNRQLLVTLSEGVGATSAVGCGIELSGSPGNFTPYTSIVDWTLFGGLGVTSFIARVVRPTVNSNVFFDIVLDVTEPGAMSCSSVINGTTTTTAAVGLSLPVVSQLGFASRETAARFTDVVVCDEE